MNKHDDDLLTISNTLNTAKVFDKIANELGLTINSDDDFFHDVEEYILENFKRMHNERTLFGDGPTYHSDAARAERRKSERKLKKNKQ